MRTTISLGSKYPGKIFSTVEARCTDPSSERTASTRSAMAAVVAVGDMGGFGVAVGAEVVAELSLGGGEASAAPPANLNLANHPSGLVRPAKQVERGGHLGKCDGSRFDGVRGDGDANQNLVFCGLYGDREGVKYGGRIFYLECHRFTGFHVNVPGLEDQLLRGDDPQLSGGRLRGSWLRRGCGSR